MDNQEYERMLKNQADFYEMASLPYRAVVETLKTGFVFIATIFIAVGYPFYVLFTGGTPSYESWCVSGFTAAILVLFCLSPKYTLISGVIGLTYFVVWALNTPRDVVQGTNWAAHMWLFTAIGYGQWAVCKIRRRVQYVKTQKENEELFHEAAKAAEWFEATHPEYFPRIDSSKAQLLPPQE